MRYEPYTYEGAKKALSIKIMKLDLNDILIPQSMQEVLNYFDYADPVRGEPQPNLEWSPVNYRNGYQNDIPGLLSEVLAQCNVAKLFGAHSVCIAQDEETQRYKKIDFFFTDTDNKQVAVQSKTIRFGGTRTSFERIWFSGDADYLALTDIDDKVCYLIKKSNAESWVQQNGLYVHKWDLENLSTYWWDMTSDY